MTQRVEVTVEGKALAYNWRGDEPLGLGDIVVLPQPWWAPDRRQFPTREGTVTRLSTDYTGSLVDIIGRAGERV
jgi:hypothetical protein